MATPKQRLASRKRHQILNEFFFADRFDPFSKPEFRSIFNAFKSEVKFRLGRSRQWDRELYDPDLGWSDAFEAEFELEGTLNDGIHPPVTITISGECPPVRPLDMRLQMDDCELEEITGFYDFGRHPFSERQQPFDEVTQFERQYGTCNGPNDEYKSSRDWPPRIDVPQQAD